MKKLAIGCAVALALCMIVFGAVSFYAYYKFWQYAAPFTQMPEIAQLDKNVANKTAFTAPANGELTEDLVRRFVAVQESMSAKLGKRVEELNAKANEFQRRQQSEHRDATPGEVLTVIKDLMGLILEAKTAQVEALNASRFSLEEYDWARRHIYAAAGLSITEFNLEKLPDAMKNGGDIKADTPQVGEDVPPRNKTLVQPYLPKLKDWAPLAVFGL